jgi:hypothetical protein
MFLGIHIHINCRKVVGADVVGARGFFGSLFLGGGVVGAIGGAVGGFIGEIVIENTNLQ